MPNFDGGHYFLTTLAPIRIGAPADLPADQRAQFDGDPGVSFVQRVQQALRDLPTAQQSPATETSPDISPFATSLRTHLCRFVVIEDAVYNGRQGDDPLLVSAGLRPEPLATQPVDQLPCAYLMFVVDFDAVKTPGDPLPDTLSEARQDAIRDHYLEAMWTEGGEQLINVYQNCQAFDAETVKTPKDFAAYMRKCQLPTWMSFNDYYVEPPTLPELPVKAFAAAVGLPALAAVWCLVAWLIGYETVFGLPSGWTGLAAAAVAAIALYAIYRIILAEGQKAWPAAKDGDLPSVLKGLYLQQNFSDFVVAHQGADAKDLHAAFGQFLQDHKPEDVLSPSQKPGVVRSRPIS
jgi:hypothetical protein